jgi:hypothetical protein
MYVGLPKTRVRLPTRSSNIPSATRHIQLPLQVLQKILHDVPLTELNGYVCSVQEEHPRPFKGDEIYSSFAEAAKRAPYLPKDKLHFARLRYLISAAASEARDHLWSLREDPLCFVEIFEAMNDHHAHRIQTKEGVKLDSANANESTEDSLRQIVIRAYQAVIDWETINEYFLKYDELWY